MDVQQALENLTQTLAEALEQAKRDGAQAFENGEFAQAQQAADRGKTIETILDGAKQLAGQWEAQGASEEQTQIQSAAALKPQTWNRNFPEEDFIFPILQVLEDLGGKGQVEEILDRVELMFKDNLSPKELQEMGDGQSNRWRDSARATQKLMVTKGYIYPNSPKGIWQITPQGRLSLFEHQS